MSGVGVALSRPDRGVSLGRLGALWGLGFSVALGTRLVQVETEPPGGGVIVGAAFAALYVTPFALVVYALRSGDTRFQIAVWTAAGVTGLALSFSSLTGMTLILLPAVGLLLAGAWLRRRHGQRHLSKRHLVLSIGLIGAAIASGFALISFPREACWALHRFGGGRVEWRQLPEGLAEIPAAPVGDSTVVEVRCRSTSSPVGAGVAIGVWLLAGTGAAAVRRIDAREEVAGT